jgi:bacterial/archaeal transporter family-2 protein
VVRLMFWFLVAVALTMGLFMAIQPAINGQLRWRVGSPAQAAMISTSVSTISLLLFVFVIQRQPWPDSGAFRDAPWWIWTGGLLGAVYVAASIVLVQRLGGAVAFSLVVLGQMLSALAIDHFGLLGLAQHEISPGRVLGVLLVVCGVVMIRVL